MATQENTHPIMVAQYLNSFQGHPAFRDELIDGRIVMTPQPKPLHQHICKNVQRLLDAICEGTDYIVNGDSNIELTPFDMPAPDVFVVRATAWEEAMRAGEYLCTPPLLAVEILSPGQEVQEKVRLYLSAGVDAVWVVYPSTRATLVYAGLEKKP